MVNIDLRKEAKNLIGSYGIDILYVRHSKYMKCKCYNELYKSGDDKCELCFGSGLLTTIEHKKCFYNNDKYYTKLSPAGKYNVDIGKFIFDNESKVGFKDFLLIVGFDGESIVDVKQVYIINNINEVRCDNGRIEFYEVDVQTDNTYVLKFNKYLRKHKLKYNFGKKVIGRW